MRTLPAWAERIQDHRGPGTIIIADLEASSQISEEAVRQYLSPYVQFLPVPVLVNGQNISQKQFENAVEGQASGFVSRPPRNVFRGAFAGELQTLINPQGRVIARLRRLSLNGTDLVGEVFFLQDGGQTQGYRNLFGLAPIPVSGNYAFGGFVNLNILHPTAGREALSRESIEHVANIVALIEAEVSNELAETDAADRNQNFQQYISTHGLIAHAKRMNFLGYFPPITMWNWEASRPLSPASLSFSTLAANPRFSRGLGRSRQIYFRLVKTIHTETFSYGMCAKLRRSRKFPNELLLSASRTTRSASMKRCSLCAYGACYLTSI